MIYLIDNYDSFSYNLYQLAGALDPDIRVVRNDQLSVADIRTLAPRRLILLLKFFETMRLRSKSLKGKTPKQ